MKSFVNDFLDRIQYEGDDDISFHDLPDVMCQFALNVPFENIDIMTNNDLEINRDRLKRKIVDNRRGGLCYELNPLFYYFLKEAGFNVQMVKATVNPDKSKLRDTHISVVLKEDERKYIIDVGFGSNQVLHPVPFNGAFVDSIHGRYRVRKSEEKDGYFYEKFINGKLEISYLFYLNPIAESEINKAKDLVTTHPNSSFNKSLLLSKITKDGHKTLTDKTYTVMENGRKYKKEIDSNRVKVLCVNEFGIEIK